MPNYKRNLRIRGFSFAKNKVVLYLKAMTHTFDNKVLEAVKAGVVACLGGDDQDTVWIILTA